jgi:hypothetical protein
MNGGQQAQRRAPPATRTPRVSRCHRAAPQTRDGAQLDHAGVPLVPGIADVREQHEGPRVVVLDERAEPAHALAPRAIRQAVEARAAQATLLPVVGDGDRDLGDLRIVLRANVACDAQRLPA